MFYQMRGPKTLSGKLHCIFGSPYMRPPAKEIFTPALSRNL
jgi:hypothetical protein